MKVVFLDFDGVLNSDPFLFRVQGERRTQGLPLFAEGEDHYMISREMVGHLNRLLAATGAFIVVSSTWRIVHKVWELKDFLAKKGFLYEDRILGRTPSARKMGHVRGNEIQDWIDAQAEKPESFVILDDSDDMAHLSHRLVRTDARAGLTEADVDRAIEMLRVPCSG